MAEPKALSFEDSVPVSTATPYLSFEDSVPVSTATPDLSFEDSVPVAPTIDFSTLDLEAEIGPEVMSSYGPSLQALIRGEEVASWKSSLLNLPTAEQLRTPENLERLKQGRQPALPETVFDKDRGTFSKIGTGIMAAPFNMVQGFGELIASGIDSVAGTNFTTAVTDQMNNTKRSFELDDKSIPATIATEITGFVLAAGPALGVMSRARAVANGATSLPAAGYMGQLAETLGNSTIGKALLKSGPSALEKTKSWLGFASSVAGVSALTDFAFSPDGRRTASDHWDVMPEGLKTEDTGDMYGRDRAGGIIRNKLRHAGESFAFSGAFDIALLGLRYGGGAVATLPGIEPVVKATSAGAKKAFDTSAAFLSSFKPLERWLTSNGAVPMPIAEAMRDLKGLEAVIDATAARHVFDFDSAVKEMVTSQGKIKSFFSTPGEMKRAREAWYEFMSGNNAALNGYTPKVREAAERARGSIHQVTDKVIDSIRNSNLEAADKQALIGEISRNQAANSYVRRVYEAHLNPAKYTDPKGEVYKTRLFEDAARQVARIENISIDEAKKVIQSMSSVDASGLGIGLTDALKLRRTNIKMRPLKPSGPIPRVPVAEEFLQARTKLMNSSPKLREFMGEVRDPRVALQMTLSDLSDTVSRVEFYKFLDEGFTTTAQQYKTQIAANPNFRPMVLKPLTREDEELFNSLGYVKMGDSLAPAALPGGARAPGTAGQVGLDPGTSAFGGQYGAVSGYYVAPELQNALTLPQTIPGGWGQFVAISNQIAALARFDKTVLNDITHLRNFYGAMDSVAQQGLLGRDSSFSDAIRMTWGGTETFADQATRDLFLKMRELGLADENVILGELKAAMNIGRQRKELGSGADAVASGIEFLMDKIPFFSPVVKKLQNVYGGTDTMFRGIAFFGEKSRFVGAASNAGINPMQNMGVLTQDLVNANIFKRNSSPVAQISDAWDIGVSGITKDVIPTYSRVVPGVEKLRESVPLIGNFTAFPAEIARTAANTVRQGVNEMAYSASPALISEVGEQAARAFERQVRAIGANRLGNYMAQGLFKAKSIVRASQRTNDISDDQYQAMVEEMPEYMSGHDLLFLGPIKNGKAEVVDISVLTPNTYLTAPIQAALRAYQSEGKVSDEVYKQVAAATFAATKELVSPFIEPSMLTQRIAESVSGRTSTGSKLYGANEETDPWTRNEIIINHVLGGLNPGIVDNFFFRERQGRWEEGRVTKAFKGTPSAAGLPITPAEELATRATGLRPTYFDMSNQIGYAGQDYKPKRSAAVGNFSRVVLRNDSTEEDILLAWDKMQRDMYRHKSELYRHIKNAETLGLDIGQISMLLTEGAGVGTDELDGILSGENIPRDADFDSLYEKMYMEKDVLGQRRLTMDLPIDRMMEIEDNYRFIPLGQTSLMKEAQEPVMGLPKVNLPKADLGYPEISFEDTVPVQSAPAPTPASQPLRIELTQPNNASVLGSNPVDAANNQEILIRQQSQ
jgi:hypothetical protein